MDNKDKSNIYFASDFHLGVPTYEKSLEREKDLVRWLDHIKSDALEIFLVGDIFDFWFEYDHVVPKGYVRLLGQIAKLTDKGIPVHVFTGNHDLWMRHYFEEELGCKVYHGPQVFHFNDKACYIAHGDGLGPGDKGYKFIKKVFASPICQWLFARLHPNFSFWLAQTSSKKSRLHTALDDEKYLGDDKEWLAVFAREKLEKEHFDYFVFGHRHYPIDIQVGENSRYINLGEWMNYCTYAEFDGENLKLLKFESEE